MMFNPYILASSILGGVLLAILAAKSASFKLSKAFVKAREIFSARANVASKWESPSHFGGPLTRPQVMEAFREDTWQREAYDDFKKMLLEQDSVYPCIYAGKGLQSDNQMYLFIDSDDLSDPRHIRSIATGLTTYLQRANVLGPNTSFLVLTKRASQKRTLEEYNSLFWKMLDGLAKLDTKPWPANVPHDIDTDKWCFCFGGERIFPAILAPVYQARRSRYAPTLTLVFQPRWIFNILFSSEAKRVGVLAKARALLMKYDSVPISPELMGYGEPGSRDCKQYVLLDENVPIACPLDKLSDSSAIKI